jgi:ubiquinone/menaquinone biosynthesis C-methylase UbiE
VIGLDPDQESVDNAASKASARGVRNIEFKCSTLESAGFQVNSFDKVVSYSVVEHIPNYSDVFSEVFRVLKPGGRFVFSTDCLSGVSDDIREKHRKWARVYTYFSVEDLTQILREKGFQDVVVRPLFTTEYARRAFIEGIQRKFNFGITYAWVILARLLIETKLSGPYAMFLIATARKPALLDHTASDDVRCS